ncbi:Ltp family lipoprotein [Mycobacterium syngnathidarum]|uniref:Ltp family lipoprotein n=1 Tax=Mycobacterium syngnathidarum TaxID=1908205 RepID=UPI00096A7162|nr:Ltp family lipoprotein [Mycobacterium syngnathidarum]
MTTYLAHTAATMPPSARSRTVTRKNRGALAAGMLLAICCTGLWAANVVGVAGPDVAGSPMQLASVVTSIDEQSEPDIRALSGPTIPLEPVSSVSQRKPVRSAKQYLDYSAFSRQRLIKQLEYEGFSTADATFAVDSIAVDWNAQAAKAAKAYLDYSGFSRSGLINQLEYEGYTPAQAAYGATAAGL